MTPRQLNNSSLLDRTKSLVAEERRLSLEIIEHLREVDRRKLYADLGYGSLFDYLVRELGYAEASAYRRIQTMRLTQQMPEVESKIREGKLSLSVASQAQVFFKQEAKSGSPLAVAEKKEILEKLEGKSAREAERELLALSSQPLEVKHERVRVLTPEHTEIRFVVNSDLMEQLERIKGLLAHKHPNLSWGELVQIMAEITIEKLETKKVGGVLTSPKANHERSAEESRPSGPLGSNKSLSTLKATHSRKGAQPPEPAEHQKRSFDSETNRKHDKSPSLRPLRPWKPQSRHIPASLRRDTWSRNGGQCTYVDPSTGRKCGSRFALEIDHRVPWAKGGQTSAENLRLLCKTHNQRAAIKVFGVRDIRA